MSRFNFRSIARASVWAIAVLLSGAQFGWSGNSKNVNGVGNFGQVTEGLFRGGQPSAAGFTSLKNMGIGIIVNFRDEADKSSSEKRLVESLGMQYVSIPWNGSDYPSDAKIVKFLDVVRSNPQTKVFVHCKRGADRTGTMIAAYRIAVQHKPVPEAVSEMHRFHYAHFFLPQLERYVTSMPELLKTNALYSAYAPAPGFAASVATATAAILSPAAVAVPAQ